MVLLEGGEGVGKSRLLREFRHTLTGRAVSARAADLVSARLAAAGVQVRILPAVSDWIANDAHRDDVADVRADLFPENL